MPAKSGGEKKLSARERQIMDVVHRLGRPSARDIQKEMPDAPSYSAVRTLLRILVEKGYLTHEEEHGRYRYETTVSKKAAGVSALRNLITTFFNDSAGSALTTLLSSEEMELDDRELDRLSKLIAEAREKKAKQNSNRGGKS